MENNQHISTFNRVWAKVILSVLLRHNVSHFCIAPGSRSTPLTLEANRLQRAHLAQVHTHFDERGLGFFALGLAKSTQKPVAIIVTSGTAAANLYPAIVEARQTGVNLFVLTADRPAELQECGANQAILQENMFGQYPVACINLPNPSTIYNPQWLVSMLTQKAFEQSQNAGVVHINVPFTEPLYNAIESQIDQHSWLVPIQSWLNQNKPWAIHSIMQQEVVMHAHWDNWRTKRGVIITGRLPLEQTMGIQSWTDTQGWILLTDVQSGVSASLPYADIWLANKTVRKKLLQADIIVQLGSGIVSKRLNQFIGEFNGEYWIVDETTRLVDPFHHKHTRFQAKAHHWLRAHPPLRQNPWLIEPLALSKFCARFIEEKVGGGLNEASLAHHIGRVLPNNGVLFLGNSLFVRLVDALGTLPENYPIFTNRGASGIDGLVATVAGLSLGSNRPVVAMLGDISTLHDLNSLALLRKVNQPTVIFVINNNGGAIFDMLPVDNTVKDELYRMPQNTEFAEAASLFKLKYAAPFTWADLNSILKQAYSRRVATIIEIKVNPNGASQLYKNLIEQIADATIGA